MESSWFEVEYPVPPPVGSRSWLDSHLMKGSQQVVLDNLGPDSAHELPPRVEGRSCALNKTGVVQVHQLSKGEHFS